MPPLPLITTVIINSNYDEVPVSHNCWTPALSLTIVLTDICSSQLSVEALRPRRAFEIYCIDGQDREEVDRTDRTGQVIVMKWKSSSFSGWETLPKVGCSALLCTSEVKIVCVLQEPRLFEEKQLNLSSL